MSQNNSKFYITTFEDFSNETYVEGLMRNIIYRKAKFFAFLKSYRSVFLFNRHNKFRMILRYIVESRIFEAIILLAIAASCVIMAMGSQQSGNNTNALNAQLEQSEPFFLGLFILEGLMKTIAYGFVLNTGSYLRNGWNIMDFAIILIGGVSIVLSNIGDSVKIDIKALRAFRVLRPLRLASSIPSLQLVLNSIVHAILPLANVGALILFLMVVYSVAGMNLFMGRLHSTCYNNVTLAIMTNPSTCKVVVSNSGYYCTGLNRLPPNQQWVCMDINNKSATKSRWPGPVSGIANFDNFGVALLTVFQMMTRGGWIDVMHSVNDAMGTEWVWIYFVSFALMVKFFAMNLILAVISGALSKQSSSINTKMKLLKDKTLKKENEDYIGYKRWIEHGEYLENARQQNLPVVIKRGGGRQYEFNTSTNDCDKCHHKTITFADVRCYLRTFIKRRTYFILILVLVFLNTIILATEFVNQPAWITKLQEAAELFFMIIFLLELMVKMVALGPRGYFSKSFNIFDFVIIFFGIIELILSRYNVIKSIGISVLRCARLLRVFKMTRYWDSIRSLVHNMQKSFKAILSLLVILALFIFIFALLGMQLFGGKFNITPKPRSHFDDFLHSIITVFQIITGNEWLYVMYNGINSLGGIQSGGGASSLYFITLYIFCNYILLNVFLAITLESLRDTEKDENEDADSITSDTDDDEKQKQLDEAAKLPEVTQNVVIINGCTLLPPEMENDIASLNKVRKKSKKRVILEQRVRIKFNADKEVVNEGDASKDGLGVITYNEIYDDEEQDNDREEIPSPTIIPKPSNMKEAEETDDSMPSETACFIFSETNYIRCKCFSLANHPFFKNCILMCIIISSVMLAAEDPVDETGGRNQALNKFDYLFTAIFSIEIIIKMIAYGVILHKGAFLRSPFNWVDLIVVIIGLVDNLLPSANIGMSAFKTLRVFRILRPLRAIKRAKALRHLLHCVMVGLKSIIKIIVITFMLEFMFAVIGVVLLKGSFYSCTDPTQLTNATCTGNMVSNSTSDNTLILTPRVWINNPLNFDNVFNGMLTLFVVSTFSGWTRILYRSIDATGPNNDPIIDNNPAMFLFYLAYFITTAFYIMNIFVSSVIVTFRSEGDAQYANDKLDKNKRQCIAFALKARPIVRYIPNEHRKYQVWKVVSTPQFDYVILLLILLNTICLAANNVNETDDVTRALKILNIIFTVLFTIESGLKIYAFEFRNYFNEAFNVFDVLVITGSYIDMVFSEIQTSSGVQINLFRLLRVLRLIRILTKVESIRCLLWTFFNSFKDLPFVLLLVVMTFSIYAIMGMQFFGNIAINNTGSAITRNNNFQTFYSSFLILFRCVTGDHWHSIMLSCIYDRIATCASSNEICGSAVSYIYFPTFIMICVFLIMNLFVAVIINNFEYLTRDDSILAVHHLNDFITVWSQYDSEGRGRIKHLDVVNMLSKINPPLGFGRMCPQIRTFRALIKLNIPLQTDGSVLFNATLFALVRKCLKIKYYDNAYEPTKKSLVSTDSDKKSIKILNDELRTILKTHWRSTSHRLLDQIVPQNINHSVTIGKFYATFIISNWFKKCMMAKQNKDKREVTELDNKKDLHPKPAISPPVDSSITKDSNLSVYNSTASIKLIYEKLSEPIWSVLEDIFTIADDTT